MVAELGAPADGTGIPVPAGGPEAHASGDPNNGVPLLFGTVPGTVIGSAPGLAQAAPSQEDPEEERKKVKRGMA